MDNQEKQNTEIEAIKPSRKIFGKIFTIIAYIVVFALGYQSATISYNRTFGNVPGMTISKMNKMENIIRENYYKEYDRNKLYNFTESVMVYGLEDPFSYYLDEESQEDFTETVEGTYVGVGLTLTPSESGEIMVIAPFDGSPAQEAGIIKNDIITKVNGTEYLYEDVDEAVKLMKGKEGETVTVEIKRQGSENFECTLTKSKIIYQSVTSELLEENILYTRVSRFDLNTYEDYVKELEKYEINENTNLILDLRDNPGGAVIAATSIADLFLDEGVIITEKYRNKKDIVERSADGHIQIRYPIIILTNSSSASASEILAGALKDHKKAIIIGENTFGKGLINQRFKIDSESSLVLSVAEYLTPNGTKIHGVGIAPDIEVKLDYNRSILTLERENDTQLQSALEYIRQSLSSTVPEDE